MSEGFVLDLGDYNSRNQQKWVEGPPTRSFWYGIKTEDRDAFTVTTYRCERCGYLESYARARVE